jgi:Cu/Ag efflux pump CusA
LYVFVPMFFLQGVSRFLFVPMAEAVVFAMICSFILSRTRRPHGIFDVYGGVRM